MVFGCFDPITGGRVNGIVSQGSRLCGDKKIKDSLPLSRDEDKFETFCETYKDFIGVSNAHERFERIWEDEKKGAGSTLTDKRGIPLLLRALYKSFPGDLYKAVISKLVWSVLVIFSIWFFVFHQGKIQRGRGFPSAGILRILSLCRLLALYVSALDRYSTNGYPLQYLRQQGQGCSYDGDLQEDDCSGTL